MVAISATSIKGSNRKGVEGGIKNGNRLYDINEKIGINRRGRENDN